MFTLDPDTLEIHISQGDTATIEFQFNGDPPTGNDALYFTVKRAFHEETLIEKKATLYGADLARITLLGEDTMNLPFGRYWWDIRIFYQNGQVLTPMGPSSFFIDEVVGDTEDHGGHIDPWSTYYDGSYDISPTFQGITLETANLRMRSNLVIRPIAVSVTENLAGGNTVYIGG